MIGTVIAVWLGAVFGFVLGWAMRPRELKRPEDRPRDRDTVDEFLSKL